MVIVVLSTAVEQVVKQVSDISLRELTEINHSFVKGVGEVNPFRLVGLFYGYLVYGAPREPPPTLYGFQIPRRPEPLQSVGFGTVLWRIIPGVFYTAKIIVSEGWVNTLTALVALFLGFAFVRVGLMSGKGSGKWSLSEALFVLLALPLIGSVFVWVLLTIMWLAGLLFGWLLVSAQTVAYFSVVGACIKFVVKEREDNVTGKIIARLTGRQ